MTETFTFNAIGTVHACYKEKFGVPRQPGLVNVLSSIEIHEPCNRPEAFRALNDFSHIWIMFVFHQTRQQGWHPTVRPPRLGGNERVGVFASRSMFRPNPIGLSVVELKAIRQQDDKLFLDIIGADLMDGTPVLDIKPYLPYADAVTNARSGYADTSPVIKLQVTFHAQAIAGMQKLNSCYPDLQQTIRDILQLDPRPAYAGAANNINREYAMRLHNLDVKWQVNGNVAQVVDVVLADSSKP
ncbi:MAG: tRNA (adenine37-N6)-methyltransferase [Pseudomonadota bacterium]|nr:tRNA (adenine37-N6)-methyltransferase [Pseudomonadota bacterium]